MSYVSVLVCHMPVLCQMAKLNKQGCTIAQGIKFFVAKNLGEVRMGSPHSRSQKHVG